LAVPFGDLPAGAGPFLEALNLTDVQAGFSSPLTAAIQGTNTFLRKRMATAGARPTARVLVAQGKRHPLDRLRGDRPQPRAS
jgi:hypothetical protein